MNNFNQQAHPDTVNATDETNLPLEVPGWVSVPLITTAIYSTAVCVVAVSYTRSKPITRKTVMDNLVVSFAFMFLVRIWVGHLIWTIRGFWGPLPRYFALVKVTSDRITMFGGLSISVVMAIVRYLHYDHFDTIQVRDRLVLSILRSI